MTVPSHLILPLLGVCVMGQPPGKGAADGLERLKAQVRVEMLQAPGKGLMALRLVTPGGSFPLVLESLGDARGGVEAVSSTLYAGTQVLLRRTRCRGEGGSERFLDEHPLLGFEASIRPSPLGIREVSVRLPEKGEIRLLLDEDAAPSPMVPLRGEASLSLEAPSLAQARREGLLEGLGPACQVRSPTAPGVWVEVRRGGSALHGRREGGRLFSRVDGARDAEGRVSLLGKLALPWPGALFFRVGPGGEGTLVLADGATGLRFSLGGGACKVFRRDKEGLTLLREVPCRPAGEDAFLAAFPALRPLAPKVLSWMP